MKILQIHNDYQISGGETAVVKNEKKILVQNNNEVIQYIVHSNEINSFSFITKKI